MRLSLWGAGKARAGFSVVNIATPGFVGSVVRMLDLGSPWP